MNSLLAIAHHLAAFAVVAALAVELVLLRGPIDAAVARRLVRADAVYGIAAAIVVAAGVLRVEYFEKGFDYYQHSLPFLLKLALFALFALAGLVSIAPTRQFLAWRRQARQGLAPTADAGTLQRLRGLVHVELVALAGVIACAALAARGVGMLD